MIQINLEQTIQLLQLFENNEEKYIEVVHDPMKKGTTRLYAVTNNGTRIFTTELINEHKCVICVPLTHGELQT